MDKKIFIKNIFISLSLFAVFAFVWLENYNRYQVISLMEEVQLFRTDRFYLQEHLSEFGGITQYIGTFLTQFFYYPYAGALIITLSLVIIFLLLYLICKKESNIEKFFILLYATPVLLLFSCTGIFWQSYLAGIILNLAFFLLYVWLPPKIQKPAGILLFTLSWFITASLGLLLGILVLIHYLFSFKKSILYIIALLIWMAALPHITYMWIYVTPMYKIWFTFTSLDFAVPNHLYIAGCLSIPVVYVLAHITIFFKRKEIKKPLFIFICYYAILFIALATGYKQFTNVPREQMFGIMYEADKGNWNAILEIQKDYGYNYTVKNNAIVNFYTNLALSEQGKLLDEMFQYPQTGIEGIFPTYVDEYYRLITVGDFYYRSGAITAAEKCAFEAFLSAPNQYSSKLLRRLVHTNALRRDTLNFEKYIHLFLHSPVYHNWAVKEKEEFYRGIINDDKPIPIHTPDFFIDFKNPEYNLYILYTQDTNKKIFDYLIASMLIKKDLDQLSEFLSVSYDKIEKEKLPVALEDAILICRYIKQNMEEEIFRKFSISEEKIKAFKQNRK